MHRAFSGMAVFAAVATGALLTRCHDPVTNPPPPPENRCEVDLAAFTSAVGNSAKARKIEAAADLLTGDAASGRLGDFRLENDKVRLIVQAPDRHIQANPYGHRRVNELYRSWL